MPHFPYNFFSNFVVRTPLFSYKDLEKRVNKNIFADAELKEICQNSIFQEAIYLASPYLYEEINQWLTSQKTLSPKLKNTILKYYIRMSTRCTPFGLFSGIGLGRFENNSSILLDFTNCNLEKIRETKPDIHLLVSISEQLLSVPFIKNSILFFPNNSIYKIGNNKIRYVEYENNEGKRDYIISSAFLSEELQKVINSSNSGKTISEMAEILINSEITKEDAKEFIEELIDNQVLVSELEPNISGEDFLNILICILERIDAKKEANNLIFIQRKLDKLDETIGNPILKYTEIEELIKYIVVNYEKKYLFQTDLYFSDSVRLPNLWKKELKKTISFLNKITLSSKNTYLEEFKKAFYERFEYEEVPLSFALDTEVGIGYRQDIQNKGIHPYLEDLLIPASKEKQNVEIKLNPVQLILNQKLQEAYLEGKNCVQLYDNDFRDFQENWEDLPETLSFMADIISENNHEKLYLNGGSRNAGRLLGRFCSKKSKIKELVKEIAEKEEELNNEKILAEIIHLPEARIGNILRRPTLRSYEIPYLGKSSLSAENTITVDDLYISIKNDRILLRSKKHNKEVIPYLTNAHNYSANSLPIYHFLCDLNAQNLRFGLHFDWGGLTEIYNFLPRVEYGNTILFKAQWRLNLDEIKWLCSLLNNKEQIHYEIKKWRKKHRLSKWIQWIKGDNTLPINLENEDLLSLFISCIKNEKKIIIEEFLCHEKSDFTNQFIFSIYKDI